MTLPKETRQGRSLTTTVITWGAVMLLLAGTVLAARRMTAPKPVAAATEAARPVLTVSTHKVEYRIMAGALSVTGSIAAKDPLTLGAEVSGLRVDQVLVEEGDSVHQGQTLAVLNGAVLRAQLAQARARLSQAQANIAKAVQPNRPQDIEGLRAALRQAEANVEQERGNLRQAQATLDNAEANERRYQQVLAQGFVTAQEAGDRTTEAMKDRALMAAGRDRVRAAEFAVEQARQRLNMAQVGGRAEDIQVAQANAQEAAASVQQLEAQLAQTVVKAPDDGLIVGRDAHVGDISSPGRSMFTMVRKSELELRAQLSEDDLLLARVGQKADVDVDGHQVTGHVWLVSPSVDSSTRLGTVRILVPCRYGLRPGMFVHGKLRLGHRQMLMVPTAAVTGQPGQYYCLRYQQGRVKKASVVPGQRRGEETEILSGLTPGDEVVATGVAFLSDGDPVAVK